MEEICKSPRTERYVRMMGESVNGTEYITYPLSEGMIMMYHRNWHTNKERLLINSQRQRVYDLVDDDGNFTMITKADVNYEGICHLQNIKNAYLLKVEYEFEIGAFTKGMALVRWQLYPDSHWFDDQGLGITDNSETSVYAYMNANAQLLCKFTHMRFEHQRKLMRRGIKSGVGL